MEPQTTTYDRGPALLAAAVFIVLGFGYFASQLVNHPESAWPAYLVNLLLWSAIAQGGLLFSMVMHMTKARWSRALTGLSESFAAFFPVSLALFLVLYGGRDYVFPWLGADLHGKEVWLNLPFLFTRDLVGIVVLYGLGFSYLYYSLGLKLAHHPPKGRFRSYLHRGWSRGPASVETFKKRMSLFSVLYTIAYALVLSLVAFDLIMSADPHWISTLFGAYAFVKAFYVGIGALIILAAVISLQGGSDTGLTPSHFHDLGKLFFGFCLIWGDFFYAQFVVIWYGNIPEETSYVIQRTMLSPWRALAWYVLGTCFVIPFFILLNRKVKTKPLFMAGLCTLVIVSICMEHLLLLGPALNPDTPIMGQIVSTASVFLGFLGLMVWVLIRFWRLFPELLHLGAQGEDRTHTPVC